MANCFSVGSEDKKIIIDRVVEYVTYNPGQVDICGDFFLTNEGAPTFFYGVHPGSLNVEVITQSGWMSPENHQSQLLMKLHECVDSKVATDHASFVSIGDVKYDVEPVAPPLTLLGGGCSDEHARMTMFKIGPIPTGSSVVRVKFAITGESYREMVGTGAPGSPVDLYGGDVLIERLLRQSISAECRDLLCNFNTKWHQLPKIYEVIVLAGNNRQLPKVQSCPDTVPPAPERASSLGSLWFMAFDDNSGSFTIRLIL